MEKIYRLNEQGQFYELIYGCDLKFDSADTLIRYVNADKSPPGWYHGKIKRHDILRHKDKWYLVLDVGEDAIRYIYVDHSYRFGYPLIEDNMICAVMVEPQKAAYTIIIPNCLEAMQSAVGGLIEAFYPDNSDTTTVAYVNDEGILLGMPPNRYIDKTVIFGNMIILGTDDEGNDISLTEEQLKKYLVKFGDPYTLKYDAETGTLFVL